MSRYGIKDNQVRAFNKLIRVSHQKLGLVCDLVRGLPVSKAVDVLKFSKKRVSAEVLKTVLSAVANADHNKKLPVDSLFIKEIWCGKSLVMKRARFGAMTKNGPGGVRRIEKPFSNLTVILESGAAVNAEPKKETKKEIKKEKAK